MFMMSNFIKKRNIDLYDVKFYLLFLENKYSIATSMIHRTQSLMLGFSYC